MLLNLHVKCTAPYMLAKKLQHLSIAVSTELLEDIDHILELYKWFRPSTSKSSKLLDNIVVFHPNFHTLIFGQVTVQKTNSTHGNFPKWWNLKKKVQINNFTAILPYVWSFFRGERGHFRYRPVLAIRTFCFEILALH